MPKHGPGGTHVPRKPKGSKTTVKVKTTTTRPKTKARSRRKAK